MPTGYTADVQKGEVTELADFALTCARGFGALILLRDSDQSLEATRRYSTDQTYVGGSTYYEDDLKSARGRLAELESMTEREALDAAQAAASAVVESNRGHAEQALVERERYEAMLAKVEAWSPPASEHVAFKEFMVEQLQQSIEFDCRLFAMPVPDVSLGWRAAEVERTHNRIARCEEEIENERNRNASRRAWVSALIDSLEAVTA